jgi:prepilin-type N-terminal cleavage/methylation domain-containing protein
MNKQISIRLERAFMRVERCLYLYFSIWLTPHSACPPKPLAKAGKRTGIDGFSLVELLIATFIASILGSLLFFALYQVNRSVPVVDNTTAIYEKAALINAQFERDLSGTTAPNEFYYRQPEPERKKKQEANAKAEPALSKVEGADKKKSEEDKKETEGEKKPKKPLEKIFYSSNKESALNQLSFLTTNPLQVYWTAKTGSAKPRIARILYELKEEKGTPKSYSLIRKESPNLEFDQITKTGKEGPQEYVLAEGIKSLTAEYTYYVPEKKVDQKKLAEQKAKGEQAEAPKEAKKKEIKKTNQWVVQEKKEGKEEEGSQLPLAPQLVELKIALWDNQKKRSVPFIFKFRVPADIPEKREAEDITQRLLGTLREFFTQSFPQPAPTRVSQRNQLTLPRGRIR